MSIRCLPCALALLLTSCGLFQKPAYEEQGWASYIADQYNGRHTTSGQIYNPHGYTAAHTTLPFGTVVKVKNLQTGQSVKVTVNDRFPSYPGRVINLSSAAAQYIGIPYQHLAQVKVTAQTVAGGGQYQGGYQTAHAGSRPHSAHGAPAYKAPRAGHGTGTRSGYLPAYNGGGAPAYGSTPAYNSVAPAYQYPQAAPAAPAYPYQPAAPTYPYQPAAPAAPTYPYQPAAPAYRSAPAPAYQPQPTGNFLPGFNGTGR